MDASEKITMVQTLVGDAEITSAEIGVYLDLAKNKMLTRLSPFGELEDLPHKYDVLQCEYAVRLFSRKGGEGEISHNENGINRSYASANDEDILSQLIPFGKVC